MTDMMITHDGGGYDETEVTPEPYSLYRLGAAIEQNGLPLVATVLRQMADAWAADRAEITRLLELVRQTDAEKRAAEMERDDARESIEYLKGEIEYWKREWAKDEMIIGSDMHRIQARAERDAALEELRLIKQTTRPVPGDLLDEKNQHGEYSMDTQPFDYALYGIAGEPQHDTSGKSCWCGATADGEGVVVHRDMAAVLTAARQLGQDDAQPDYAAARSAVESELRAIAHIYGTAAGLEPLDSISGMLSQISNIITAQSAMCNRGERRGGEMSETPFDYAAYGINGDPEHHNTDSVLCWCAPTYDPERGIVVHRDMDEILSAARALGQADKADELARLTAERDALRSAMSEAERRLTAQFWPIDPDKYGLRYVGLEVAQKLRAALAAPEGVKP